MKRKLARTSPDPKRRRVERRVLEKRQRQTYLRDLWYLMDKEAYWTANDCFEAYVEQKVNTKLAEARARPVDDIFDNRATMYLEGTQRNKIHPDFQTLLLGAIPEVRDALIRKYTEDTRHWSWVGFDTTPYNEQMKALFLKHMAVPYYKQLCETEACLRCDRLQGYAEFALAVSYGHPFKWGAHLVVRLERFLNPYRMVFKIVEANHGYHTWLGKRIRLMIHEDALGDRSWDPESPVVHLAYVKCTLNRLADLTEDTTRLLNDQHACMTFLAAQRRVYEGIEKLPQEDITYIQQLDHPPPARQLWEDDLAEKGLIREIFSFVCGTTYFG